MRILMLFFVIFSFSVHSQHSYIPKKTDQNFYNYLKNKFEPEFLIQKNKKRKFSENFIFGKIHETCTLLNLNKINSFSISYPGKENKFLAAILHGISNNSTYEFLADDYEQYSSSKSILFKERFNSKNFGLRFVIRKDFLDLGYKDAYNEISTVIKKAYL